VAITRTIRTVVIAHGPTLFEPRGLVAAKGQLHASARTGQDVTHVIAGSGLLVIGQLCEADDDHAQVDELRAR
jgi:hypothetical protein